MSAELTQDEETALIRHIGAWRFESKGLAGAEHDFIAEANAIVAARLASVEAELDEWRSAFHQAGVDANSYAERAEAAEALVEAGLALADEWEAPANECGSHQDEDEFDSKHYPSAGWTHCDGCSAAESADRERAALAAALRAALGGAR